ncbi:MAG: glycosyltransferase, partial [bacterium]
ADGSIAPRTLQVPFGFDPPPPLDDSTIRRYRAAWGLDPDDSYMLWTGGLWPWMDPLAVVTAFEAAVNDFPTAHLVFPGTKALSGIGQALAQELCTRAQGSPCRDRIHCVDWIPAADWPHVAGGARIHVQADRPGWEAWISNRTRLLESLAHLLPVATTNHDPLTRSLQANWLVRSAPTLAEALVSAWHAFPMPEGHPELLVDLEQERDRYRWDVCVEALLKAAREGFTASPDKGQLNPIKTWIEQYPIPPPPGPLQKLWDRTLGHR